MLQALDAQEDRVLNLLVSFCNKPCYPLMYCTVGVYFAFNPLQMGFAMVLHGIGRLWVL
jgi:hypothetical protein